MSRFYIKMPLSLSTCHRNNSLCIEWDVKRYQLNALERRCVVDSSLA